MFQRLWNFVKRHRKKCIFTGIIAGGAILAWKVLLPRLQERLLLAALEALTKDAKESAAADSAEEQVAKRRQTWRKARFRHRQEESDKQVRIVLAKEPFLRARHRAVFGIDTCMAKLREATSPAEREQRFCEFQVALISQMVSAVYALNMLLLLHRVIYNIIGRNQDANSADVKSVDGASSPNKLEVDSVDQADDATHEAFYEAATYFQDRGVEQLPLHVQSAVEAYHDVAKLGPRSTVNAEDLERHFMTICSRLNSESLGEGSQMVAAMLPDFLSEGSSISKKVQELLKETQDYLESPQFHEAMRAVVRNSVKQLVDRWGDAAPDPNVAPLGGGRAVPIAKLHRHFADAGPATLNASDDENPLLTQFAKESAVVELCEAIDFEEDVKSP